MHGGTYGEDEAIWRLPAILVDKHGALLLWYLPGILLDSRQVCSDLRWVGLCLTASKDIMQDAIHEIPRQLRENAPKNEAVKQKPSWRRNNIYFRSPPGSYPPPGTPTFAPGWFPMGIKVGILI